MYIYICMYYKVLKMWPCHQQGSMVYWIPHSPSNSKVVSSNPSIGRYFSIFFSPKWDKKWRNMWSWEGVQTARVILGIFNFRNKTFLFVIRSLIYYGYLTNTWCVCQVAGTSKKSDNFYFLTPHVTNWDVLLLATIR